MSLPAHLQLHQFSIRNQTIQVLTCEIFQGHVLTSDTDLTGFMVWPASHLLATFISSHSSLLAHKTVLEVGSGSGLTGILASRFAREVVLSDMSVSILQLVESHLESRDREKVKCRELLWGEKKHLDGLLSEFPSGFDVVIGADIVYPGTSSSERLIALLDTAVDLLQTNPQATFICAYLSRHCDTDVELANEAQARHLKWKVFWSKEFAECGDYLPSILDDACIIQFSPGRSANERRVYDKSNLPEWSTTLCGRNNIHCNSPESWCPPDEDLFDEG